MLVKCLVATDAYGFNIVGGVCDGAGEHSAFQKACGQLSVADVRAFMELGVLDGDLLGIAYAREPPWTDDYKPEWGDVPASQTDLKIALFHPITRRLVFLMSDPPHDIKKLNSNLYKSAKKGSEETHSTRSIIKYEIIDGKEVECPLSLRQMRDVWKARGASSSKYGISYDTKFTEKHFAPDASMKMRVRPAAQNLSATMAHWLDDDVKKEGHIFNTALKLYCEKANRFFDIMNGKDNVRTGATGVVHGGDDPKLAELTSYAAWFEAWKHDLAKRGLTKAEQEAAFVSHQTYHDVRLTCHGFVWCVKYYTMEGMPGHGRPVYPQHFSQDTLEHHFRNIRGANGDKHNPNISECRVAAQSGALMRLSLDKKSNSGTAPLLDVEQPLLKKPKPG